MIRKIIEASVENKFITILFVVIACLWGLYAILKTPIDAIPDLSDVQVIIESRWMGQDPQTIEDQVTYPLSNKMLQVPGVKDVRGYSFFGFSLVYVIFEDGTDLYWARSRVLEYLSELSSKFPPGVTSALGPDATGVGWAYEYTIEEDVGEGKNPQYDLAQLRTIQDWYVRYFLMSVPGVSEVASVGGYVNQYQIEVDPNRLAAYRIPLKKVIMAVRQTNNQVGARVLEMAEKEFMVRGLGYVKTLGDLRKTVISASPEGIPVLLEDVAEVHRGPDIRRGLAEKNGQGEVVGGVVVIRFGEDTLEVIQRVKEKIKNIIEPALPPGVKIKTAYDRTALIHRAVDTLKHKILEEFILVSLICILFLWHFRSSLVAILTIPIGILMSFIVMFHWGINSNIMSLGGIAIAIGAMVDAAIVMIENCHKKIEKFPDKSRWTLAVEASIEVGPALFFSLLIITVSFFPVFLLPAQSGRLFRPLAFTKTFAMAAASLLSITAVPLLMGLLIRGRITEEEKNPLNKFLITVYRPMIKLVLRFKIPVILIAVVVLILTYFSYKKIGSEFMPPLNEGDVLYMPTTVPGISIQEAKRMLQTQDKLFTLFPEVETVFGKIGRAETPTDPAPLTMVETTVSLKPEEKWPERVIPGGYFRKDIKDEISELKEKLSASSVSKEEFNEKRDQIQKRWEDKRRELNREIRLRFVSGEPLSDIRKDIEEREGRTLKLKKTTFDRLMYEEMEAEFKFPGIANAWTMPIKTRIDMLSTGIKTPIGIKVLGSDLGELERISIEVERLLTDEKTRPEGTLSAIADRALGGNYIDIKPDRSEMARYGLSIDDLHAVIKTAVGGMNISTTIEKRERFPINIRYLRSYRNDPEKLKRVLINTAGGQQIPLGLVADINIKKGPPGIKSENGFLESIIFVDIKDIDVGTYVKAAKKMLSANLDKALEKRYNRRFSYGLEWSGQYEYMEEANRKLKVVVPVVIIIIFLLLYFNFRNIIDCIIVMLSLPFAVVGGIWLMYLMDFNMSVGVAVGFIALAGVAAETGVVMIIFLNIAWENRLKQGLPATKETLYDAIMEGAVNRVRPKMMTVCAIIGGLLPIMWSLGAGSRAMKRIAAPMVGGMVSSTILTLIVIPAVYAVVMGIWLKLRKE